MENGKIPWCDSTHSLPTSVVVQGWMVLFSFYDPSRGWEQSVWNNTEFLSSDLFCDKHISVKQKLIVLSLSSILSFRSQDLISLQCAVYKRKCFCHGQAGADTTSDTRKSFNNCVSDGRYNQRQNSGILRQRWDVCRGLHMEFALHLAICAGFRKKETEKWSRPCEVSNF